MNKTTIKIILLSLSIHQIGCHSQSPEVENNKQIFKDITQSSGISTIHKNGMNGNLYFAEMMGAAVALLDYDNDGDLDIYLGQGGELTNNSNTTEKNFGTLYQNNLEAGTLSFTDVTQLSGLISSKYNMGIATGDINNDGYVDVYLTNFGENQMFINNTDGTFSEVTKVSNTIDISWSTSAAFFDMNGDDWLDLYITNYVNYAISSHKDCIKSTGTKDYCGPNAYPSLKDRLFKNNGNGIFTDISSKSNILLKGAGLGVVTGDYNLDKLQDIYVTNDMGHNFLWINSGNGSFQNEALMRGGAVNKHGKSEASMGVDAGDFDNDGDLDIFMTHLLNETNTIYKNDGKGFFIDATSITGLAEPSKGYTGFGTAFLDYDNDGWLDIFAINGEVRQIQNQIDAGEILPLKQSNQLFHNKKGMFEEVTDLARVLSIQKVSRGSAIGDIDNDGDTDILVSNNNDRPQLLINQVGSDNNWIGIKLIDNKGKYMLGSVATITLKDGQIRQRRSHTDASYISANDPRIIIGLMDYTDNVNVVVNWSNGRESEHHNLKINQYHELIYITE
ncbi:MAG: CRTAC1 family protein [Marinicellaceae bacterium]